MKVLVISLLYALAGGVTGSLQAWSAPQLYPGAVVRTFIPPQVRGFAYSSQIINSIPSAAYSVGFQPQFAYQVSAIQPAYYPASHSIFPARNVFLTTVPGIAPAFPSLPVPVAPSAPEASNESNTDSSDTTVVESANQLQNQQPSILAPTQSGQSSPVSSFPNFPSIPQIPHQQEQGSQNIPQFPQSPSDADYTQGPGSAPPSFFGDDKGINDEDTVSIESA